MDMNKYGKSSFIHCLDLKPWSSCYACLNDHQLSNVVGAEKDLTILGTYSHKVGVEVASWHHHPNMEDMQVM